DLRSGGSATSSTSLAAGRRYRFQRRHGPGSVRSSSPGKGGTEPGVGGTRSGTEDRLQLTRVRYFCRGESQEEGGDLHDLRARGEAISIRGRRDRGTRGQLRASARRSTHLRLPSPPRARGKGRSARGGGGGLL